MVAKAAPDMEAALVAADGLPLVLVGGQATLLWAHTYALQHSAATDDVDWHATSKAAARSYAERLQVARFEESSEGFHLAVAETAEGTLVDFLTTVFGVDAGEDVPARASVLVVGGVELRVIHPVHLLASKLANLRLPGRGSAMDVEQARVAVAVAARFCADTATDNPRQARKLADAIFDVARSRHVVEVCVRHAIDPFAPVQPWAGMDPDFVERRFPRYRTRIDELIERERTRQGA